MLTTDASHVVVAAILAQPDDEGYQHPVAYESRKLTAAGRNYPAHGRAGPTNGRKDDWGSHLPLAVFAINYAGRRSEAT